MEDVSKCPLCHIEVRPSDYFCFNCGNNLKPKPLSTSATQQVLVYLKSIFLTPYGLIIGLRYLREKESRSKVVGLVAMVLSLVTMIVVMKLTFDLINNINEQVNTQMLQMGAF